MNKHCDNFMIRRKKGQIYYYCKLKRAIIERNECFSCNCKELKKVAKNSLKTQNRKPIKKVSKKRITVSKETYNIVFDECTDIFNIPHCKLCSKNNTLVLHHILYRSQRKDLIDEPSNCIMLCNDCHLLVHSNKKKYQPILIEIMNKKEN